MTHPNPADLAAQAKSLALSYAISMHNLVQPNDITRAKRDELFAAIDALLAAATAIPAEGQAVATVIRGEPFEDGSPNPCNDLEWALPQCQNNLPIGTKLYVPASQQEGEK
jgi:hypothetical protein